MTIKLLATELALSAVARWLTSSEAWEHVRTLVTDTARLDIDSDEKHRLVKTQVKQMGWRWADWALNLLIEIAVARVKQKTGAR